MLRMIQFSRSDEMSGDWDPKRGCFYFTNMETRREEYMMTDGEGDEYTEKLSGFDIFETYEDYLTDNNALHIPYDYAIWTDFHIPVKFDDNNQVISLK